MNGTGAALAEMEQRDFERNARKLDREFGQGVWRWGCGDCGRTGTLAGVWVAAMSAALSRHQSEGLAYGERCAGLIFVERDAGLDPGGGVDVYRPPSLGLSGVFAAAIAREENRRLFAEPLPREVKFSWQRDLSPLHDQVRFEGARQDPLDGLAARAWAWLQRNGFPGWRKH